MAIMLQASLAFHQEKAPHDAGLFVTGDILVAVLIAFERAHFGDADIGGLFLVELG